MELVNASRNIAAYGPSLFLQDGSLAELSIVDFSLNTATECGGAIGINSTLQLGLKNGIIISSNYAKNGGGICSLLRNEETQECSSATGVFPFLLNPSGTSEVHISYNKANAGGGAFFAQCGWPGPATTRLGTGPDGQTTVPDGQQGVWRVSGNAAAYGDIAATQAVQIMGGTAAGASSYMPGELLAAALWLSDSFRQTVRPGEAAALPYELIIQIPSPVADGGVAEESVFCRRDGSCPLADGRIPVLWPPAPTASPRRQSSARGFVSVVSVRVDLRRPGGEASPPRVASLAFNISRRPCPAGTAYSADAWVCAACRRTQYVVDPDQVWPLCAEASRAHPSHYETKYIEVL